MVRLSFYIFAMGADRKALQKDQYHLTASDLPNVFSSNLAVKK